MEGLPYEPAIMDVWPAVVRAIDKLCKVDITTPAGRSMLNALSSAVRQTAEPYFDSHALDGSRRELLLLAIDRQIAEDVAARRFDERFSLSTYRKVER